MLFLGEKFIMEKLLFCYLCLIVWGRIMGNMGIMLVLILRISYWWGRKIKLGILGLGSLLGRIRTQG